MYTKIHSLALCPRPLLPRSLSTALAPRPMGLQPPTMGTMPALADVTADHRDASSGIQDGTLEPFRDRTMLVCRIMFNR